jgi:hypothetical protein
MFFEEVHRSIHKIIALLHLAVDSEGPPKAIDQTTSDEMSINFDDTLHAYGSVFQDFWGMSLAIEMEDGGKAFCASRKSRTW